MKVFVLDTNKKFLQPCRPKRAKILLNSGKAAVFLRYPFTIILKEVKPEADPRPLRYKLDPGSNTDGIAILDQSEVVFAAEVEHRGQQIHYALKSRRGVRQSRRRRKTRYREPRFLNRKKVEGWLAPSTKSRVFHCETWLRRLSKLCNIQYLSMELARFDTQKMQNPDIEGEEYQQGTLAGYEKREYLLEKWGRKCAYCGEKNIPLQVEHIIAKARGGTDRVSNLTISCKKCNDKKKTNDLEVFLKHNPEKAKKIKSQLKKPLKDAAAVNSTRWAILKSLKDTGLPLEIGSGGRTKFNRARLDLHKEHWIDAACVGESTPDDLKIDGIRPLRIKATGHGRRQMVQNDKHGFTDRGQKVKCSKFVHGFQTGDMVTAIIPAGKKNAGKHSGKVVIRSTGRFDIRNGKENVGVNWKRCKKVHRADGYAYSWKQMEMPQTLNNTHGGVIATGTDD